MAETAGEARARLLAAKQAARSRTHDRLMRSLRANHGNNDVTESGLVLDAFSQGWDVGYKEGYQEALTVLKSALRETIRMQRGGIMAQL